MKINKNDLKKIVQESVIKMMNEGLSDEMYLQSEMDSLAEMLMATATDFITNLDDDRVTEEVKSAMLDNIESQIQSAVDNTRRDALFGHY
jgi:hypothetical protein